MTTGDKGTLGEAKTVARLVELGFGVFLPLSGHAPFDIVAYRPHDSKMIRISCKSCYQPTSHGSYDVGLRQTKPSSNGFKVSLFDSTTCDLVACYIGPLDKVCFVDSREIDSKSAISFRETESKYSNTKKSRVVQNYVNVPELV